MKTLFTLLITLFIITIVKAQTNQWISTSPGNWNVAGNWSDGIPDASDVAEIPVAMGQVTIPTGYHAFAKAVHTQSNLVIEQNASLTIDGSSDQGIQNWNSITNNGTINISNALSNGIFNVGSNASFKNYGNINCLSSIGGDGIRNVASAAFTNETNGEIEISNTTDDGIENYQAMFTNKGKIYFLASIGDHGIATQQAGSFTNESGGEIEISNTGGNGIIFSDNSTIFSNSGMITVLTGIGLSAIQGELGATFTNTGTGQILISHAGQHGINISSSSSYTNKSEARLEISNTTQNGINRTAGDFINEQCGIIILSEKIYDVGTVGIFSNAGFLFQDYNGTNTTSISNNTYGVIEDIQGSFPSIGIINWGYIVAPLSGIIEENQPVYNALMGQGNGVTVLGDRWYTDYNLTASAGTFSYPNTWTPNSNAQGLSQFFIEFHNGSCGTIMEINLESAVLPVELLSFEVKAIEKNVEINWSTASETNNDYFTVQRSQEGKEWKDIARIKGMTHSYEVKRYKVIDEHPLNGHSYYRLKQTDFNGSIDYSKVKSIERNPSESELKVYPNPTYGKITLEGNDLHQFKIYNATGQEIKQSNTTIQYIQNQVTIDLSRVLAGIYFIKTEKGVIRVQKL